MKAYAYRSIKTGGWLSINSKQEFIFDRLRVYETDAAFFRTAKEIEGFEAVEVDVPRVWIKDHK